MHLYNLYNHNLYNLYYHGDLKSFILCDFHPLPIVPIVPIS